MTRINLVKPKDLYDQHLVAEYREIFMVGSSLQRSLKSPNWKHSKIPDTFTLNRGHVTFFYDKGLFLYKRYISLRIEMRRRGMSPDPDRIFKKEQFPNLYFKDWTPTKADIEVSKQRIDKRISEKPNWYRKTQY